MRLNILSLLTVAATVTHTSADTSPYFHDDAFDAGAYGAYPVQTYNSTDLISPRPNILLSSPECEQNLYTMMTLRGSEVTDTGKGPTILDSAGRLVWSKGGYGEAYNLQVQKYKGKEYLTFWGGDDTVGGHGAGYYYMVSFAILA